MLQANLEDFSSAVNETAVLGQLVTAPFDPQNRDVVDQYKSLFERLGTHVITGATYGARFQLVSSTIFLPPCESMLGFTTSGPIVNIADDLISDFSLFCRTYGLPTLATVTSKISRRT